MSEELFARLEHELFAGAEIVDLRGWGESLILPEFEDRAQRVAAHGCAIRVVTNLSFRKDRALEVLACCGAWVGISIDTADPALLRDLRGGASLERITENSRRLSELYAERGIIDRLNLYLTIQRPALATIERVIDWADSVGVRDVRIAPVTTHSDSGLGLAGCRAEILGAVERIRERAKALGVSASLSASLFEGQCPKVSDETACIHPWMYCYIAYDGRVGFCDHLIGPHGDPYILGNLSESSFDEIWNGGAWKALRAEHLERRRAQAPHFAECSWCYRERHVDSENLLEPALEPQRVVLR